MSAIPGNLETAKQPPMTLPLRHFVVALAFLLAGLALGLGAAFDALPGMARLGHIHVLLAGWVCITIMGAMTQFVPVWSGASLHSRRLASAQLWLVVAGLAGFAYALVTLRYELLAAFGAVMLLGFWVFVYNIARTLPPLRKFDITEAHFALALAFFVLATALGFALAADFAWPFLYDHGFARGAVVGAHVSLAVFGAVLTTVVGAIYQLATMFTQTDIEGIDARLQQFEAVAYPVGVVALAGGRLFEVAPLATTGGLLLAVSLAGVGVIVARRLRETTVEWTPMLSRYAVVAAAMVAWGTLATWAWVRDPLAREVLLGPPGAVHLLTFGVVGFVVFGTLYHVVPFIVWIHRYSDLLGYEQVPMIDDLYSSRLAMVDFGCLFASLLVLVASAWLDLPTVALGVGGALGLLGGVVFVANMLLVVREHSPHTLAAVVTGLGSPEESTSETPDGS
jgi:hypothetical protein